MGRFLSIDLQKAGLWKRVAAWLLDFILLSVLAVGCIYGLSVLLKYDSYQQTVNAAYAKYEQAYGVEFDIDVQTYEAMTEEQRKNYDAAYEALIADEEAMYAYDMLLNLSLMITTVGLLVAALLTEFILPLVFGNGATVGKKIFGLGLIRTDSVKANTMQLFVRALIGKYTVEIMIPVYLILMMFWGIMDVTGTIVLCILGIAQILCYALTRTNSLLHDLIAGTAVVDATSQMIFPTTEDLIAFQKKAAAERAARENY